MCSGVESVQAGVGCIERCAPEQLRDDGTMVVICARSGEAAAFAADGSRMQELFPVE